KHCMLPRLHGTELGLLRRERNCIYTQRSEHVEQVAAALGDQPVRKEVAISKDHTQRHALFRAHTPSCLLPLLEVDELSRIQSRDEIAGNDLYLWLAGKAAPEKNVGFVHSHARNQDGRL